MLLQQYETKAAYYSFVLSLQNVGNALNSQIWVSRINYGISVYFIQKFIQAMFYIYMHVCIYFPRCIRFEIPGPNMWTFN